MGNALRSLSIPGVHDGRDEKDVDVWVDGLPGGKTQKDLICKILKNRKGPVGSTWKLDLVAHTMQIGANAVACEKPKSKKGKLSV